MKIAVILSLTYIIACRQPEQKIEKQILDFGPFTIQTPKGWKKAIVPGTPIDSFVGDFITNSNDTIHFSLGWFSNNLNEHIPFIIYRGNVSSDMDTSDLIIMDSKFWDPDKFRKNNIYWDTISGYEAKIIVPIKAGQGTTGVYFDSCGSSNNGRLNFNMFGNNLKQKEQEEVLVAIRTIKFKRA